MSKARIVVAEDDADHIVLLKRALKRYARPLVLSIARDGQQALELLEATEPPPDLVLLDINMPRRTGLEVLRALRGMPGFTAVPVVILTTSAREEDAEASYALGADAFVTKPTSFADFVEVLYAMLDKLLPAPSPDPA